MNEGNKEGLHFTVMADQQLKGPDLEHVMISLWQQVNRSLQTGGGVESINMTINKRLMII